jgi:hypothetical protein
MDSHRSFEFDRYPFDDVASDELAEEFNDGQGYSATDITHGMEIGGIFNESHANSAFGD